jgi:hypothetical protein
MGGQVVHTWPIGTNPHLLDNGNILDAAKDDPSGFQGFREVDWDGKTALGIDTYQKRRPPGIRPQRKDEGRPARNDHS